jgi:hypothetical protein
MVTAVDLSRQTTLRTRLWGLDSSIKGMDGNILFPPT